ncbi:MAG: choline ABC transporter ATP-binding protein [Rhodospirillales bacterium]|nr:MAG: choline ABC transporter ATP-binding protein [Rhodospirillales bacterium]
MAVVEFRNVDVIFGADTTAALTMLDNGAERDAILEATGAVVGVHDASLAVEEGEICVLMGLSGSGKSSLLRCVNGLNKATRGQVLVADAGGTIDVASCSAATLRRLRSQRIAMVFQQFALLPWRTVAENVGLGLELRGMSKAARDAIVEDKLKLVHLEQWKDKYAHELSGGMQQRVGLARAFATDADILLMDEPFSALDPLIREHLQDELLELQRSLKKTIVFVSHDLDEALKLGTHIAIMQDGKIIQYGRPEEIVARPATEYVRAFVANVNPLNVLRGVSLMRPTASLDRAPGAPDTVCLDEAGEHRCRLDESSRPEAFFSGDRDADCVAWSPDLALETVRDSFVSGTPDIPMRAAIEIRHATGRPMPMIDRDGVLIGVIGENELLAGMMRRSGRLDS